MMIFFIISDNNKNGKNSACLLPAQHENVKTLYSVAALHLLYVVNVTI